jgi:asparagine synthase (glutamine-hydrolysing)
MDKIKGFIKYNSNTVSFDYTVNSESDIFENKDVLLIIYGSVNYFNDKDNENKSLIGGAVVYNLYKKNGLELLSYLSGNYLIVLYDKYKDKLYLVRDFFGKWPIYYYHKNKEFYFSSSLKSLEQNSSFDFAISHEALSLYFQLTYIPSPFCIYEGVHKLVPNHYIEYDCVNFNYTIHEIDQSHNEVKKPFSFNEARVLVHDKVLRSVENSISENNDTGAFLSGGVDSSIVSLCYSKLSSTPIKTFSLGFATKNYDETNKSKIVANLIGSNHHEFVLESKNIMADIDKIITGFDEPFADSSALPSYYIAAKASQKVSYVLTGDGGDEVFGGYNKYYIGKINRIYTNLFHERVHGNILNFKNSILMHKSDTRGVFFKLNKLLNSIDYQGDFFYNIISLGFHKDEIKELLLNENNLENSFDYYKNKMLGKSHTIHDFRKIDKMISLEGDMIVKVSKTSDLSNIKTFSPLLNKDLWHFSNSLPESYLMKGWNKKYILKEAFKEYFPMKFFEAPKRGFGVPVGDWLRRELKDELMYYSDNTLLKEQGIFNIDYVGKLISNHINSIEDNTFKVWTFFCFQKWFFNTKVDKKNND